MQIDLNLFHDTFFQESAEHLAGMEAALLQLERNPGDPELLNTIFRAAHSIKGASSTFGFAEVMRFTHAMETLLDRLRRLEIQATPARIDLLLRSGDVLRELLAAAASGAPTPANLLAHLEEALAEISSNDDDAAVPAQPAAPPNSPGPVEENAYRVYFRPAAGIFEQAMDPLLLLRDLCALDPSAVTTVDLTHLPRLEELDPELCYLAWEVRLRTSKTPEDIRDIFAFAEDGAEIRIESANASKDDAPKDIVSSGEKSAAAIAPTQRGDATLRVAASKVDKLIDLVGELVIAQSMANQILDNLTPARLGELREAMAATERHIRELQERVMSVRMLPIGHIFGRFSRVVRDLAAQLGKQVRLEVAGEETELDKSVVEQISDPLMHLIRNALDHGIEDPEERRRAGKPPEGCIRLEAYHRGGAVIVEVSDDGRGLDAKRIRGKAVERGLIAEGAPLTEEQIWDLVFAPGFSTAEIVSDVSGRGVGMDVVKRNIEALSGSVALESGTGRGCSVRINLPLTLAILDGLCVKVGAETYVLPLLSIVESIRPRADQVQSVAGQGEVVVVRGEALPLARLDRLFLVAGAVADPCRGLTVIVEAGGKHSALLVDELLGQQQVVVKSLEAHYRKVEGVLGATILGDGRPALILDVAELAKAARRPEPPALAA